MSFFSSLHLDWKIQLENRIEQEEFMIDLLRLWRFYLFIFYRRGSLLLYTILDTSLIESILLTPGFIANVLLLSTIYKIKYKKRKGGRQMVFNEVLMTDPVAGRSRALYTSGCCCSNNIIPYYNTKSAELCFVQNLFVLETIWWGD